MKIDQDSYQIYKKDLEKSLGINGISPPPKPMNAYMRFFMERSCEERSKGSSNWNDITKLVSEEWKKLPENKREFYEKIHEIRLREKNELQDEYENLTKKKKPLAPYARYHQKRYSQYAKELKNSTSADITRLIRNDWKAISTKEKTKLEEEYEKEKNDFALDIDNTDRVTEYKERLARFIELLKEDKEKINKKYGINKESKLKIKRIEREEMRNKKRAQRQLEKEQRRQESLQQKRRMREAALQLRRDEKERQKKIKEEQRLRQKEQHQKEKEAAKEREAERKRIEKEHANLNKKEKEEKPKKTAVKPEAKKPKTPAATTETKAPKVAKAKAVPAVDPVPAPAKKAEPKAPVKKQEKKPEKTKPIKKSPKKVLAKPAVKKSVPAKPAKQVKVVAKGKAKPKGKAGKPVKGAKRGAKKSK